MPTPSGDRNMPLDPSCSYSWRIRVRGPVGDGRRWVDQEHWGTHSPRPGETALDVMEILRQDCARRMDLPVHTAEVAAFNITKES